MTCSLLDGNKVASVQQQELQSTITKYLAKGKRAPGLAVILLGDDPASAIYVAKKRQACADVGMASFAYDLPTNTSEKDLLGLIETLNQSDEVDGILIQLPLPSQINTKKLLAKINPGKDVDGFHPYNLGLLAQGNPYLRPCTPYGIIQLLNYYKIDLVGKNAVVLGSSNIVGRPMALELLNAKATVTIANRYTKNLETHVKNADILIVATGVKDVIPSAWLQPEQVVIDVGIHRMDDGNIRGDVDFDKAKNRVSWLTPVPGGVGPMTILTLLKNTLLAYETRQGINNA